MSTDEKITQLEKSLRAEIEHLQEESIELRRKLLNLEMWVKMDEAVKPLMSQGVRDGT